jgi:hypothetical protein
MQEIFLNCARFFLAPTPDAPPLLYGGTSASRHRLVKRDIFAACKNFSDRLDQSRAPKSGVDAEAL